MIISLAENHWNWIGKLGGCFLENPNLRRVSLCSLMEMFHQPIKFQGEKLCYPRKPFSSQLC